MRKRDRRHAPDYPQGDHPYGVTFYLIDELELPWAGCKAVLRDIAIAAAQRGPFRLRFGFRDNEDRTYWIGLNSPEAAAVFETQTFRSIRRTAKRLPEGDPKKQLNPVLDDRSFQSHAYGQSDGPSPADDGWEARPPEPKPAEKIKYQDEPCAVILYRLSSEVADPTAVIEAIRGIAGWLWRPPPMWSPFAVRYGYSKEPGPNSYYWIGLNSVVAGSMLEVVLKELGMATILRSRPRTKLLLDPAIHHPGMEAAPAEAAKRTVHIPAPLRDPAMDLETEDQLLEGETPQAAKVRRKWARAATAAVVARLRGGLRPRRRRGQDSQDPLDEF